MAGFINSPSNLCHLTRDEHDALQGTVGNPSDSNRYLTDQDPRILPASNTNSGTMSASDYVLLHTLASGSISGLTDLQMAMLAQVARSLLVDGSENVLALPILQKYINIDTFNDGILLPGSTVTNLSRNGGKLTLKPDSSTNISLLDDCTSTSSWNTYNPSSNGASEGVPGFSHSVEYWDLIGQNALKQTLVNASSVDNEWYEIAANYRRHNKSNCYGFLVTTKISADNNPILAGWDNRYNRCVKQNIDDDLFYEDFWIPFSAAHSVTDMTVGIYCMFPASPLVVWFSNIRAVTNNEPVMATSGVYTSKTTIYDTNIRDVIVIDSINLKDDQDGSWQLDISLDGGTHWKTNIVANTVLNVATDLANADGNAWNNLKNLQVRYTLTKGAYNELGRGPELAGVASIVRTE